MKKKNWKNICNTPVKRLIILADSGNKISVAYAIIQFFFVKLKPAKVKLEFQKPDTTSIALLLYIVVDISPVRENLSLFIIL